MTPGRPRAGWGFLRLEITMTFYTELDVVNDMLATLGESPLNSIDEDHSLTASALRVLRVVNLAEQAKEWWFNKELITLVPDPVSKFVYTPADAISVDPVDTQQNYVQRGRRLYNTATGSYEFDAPIRCNLVRQLPFEETPPLFQTYVSVTCQIKFQKDYDGDATKASLLQKEWQVAWATFNAEHIRCVSANLLNTSSVQQKLAGVGGRGGQHPAFIGGRFS